MQEWRDSAARNQLSTPREAWLREDLYALFQGNRYRLVEGAVKLRRSRQLTTDVDAVVYDRISGELALFQIKWQDLATQDVRELRSKAKNFTTGVSRWAVGVKGWAGGANERRIQQSLRLKAGEPIRRVLLFALARSGTRFQGYGFRHSDPDLACGSWPQFVRLRLDIGPKEEVLSEVHRRLLEESDLVINAVPVPTDFQIGGMHVRFADWWQKVDAGVSDRERRPET